MTKKRRSIAFWVIVTFFSLTLIIILMGQTLAVFNYDFAVRLGLQENIEEVSEFGVQINRALGAADTIVYLPLIISSLIGLFLRKSWSLFTTGAVMGISAYWAFQTIFMLTFLKGVSGFNLMLGVEYWVVLITYIVFGVCGLFYLIVRGNRLVE